MFLQTVNQLSKALWAIVKFMNLKQVSLIKLFYIFAKQDFKIHFHVLFQFLQLFLILDLCIIAFIFICSIFTCFSFFLSVPSQILFSSKCMKTSNRVNCSCETVGNPSPTTHWYLNGKPVIQSSQMVITHEFLNSSYLRSIITVDEPQDRDLSTLQCFSSNSLGSFSKGFCVSYLDNSRENEGMSCLFKFANKIHAGAE